MTGLIAGGLRDGCATGACAGWVTEAGVGVGAGVGAGVVGTGGVGADTGAGTEIGS